MAEDKAQMSQEQGERAAAWLERAWVGVRACPVCGSSDWTVGNHFVSPVVISPTGNIMLGGPIYPHLMVTSKPCGYAVFINAIIAGLFDPEGGEHGA